MTQNFLRRLTAAVGELVGAGDVGLVACKVGFGVGDLVGCQKKIKNNILASKRNRNKRILS